MKGGGRPCLLRATRDPHPPSDCRHPPPATLHLLIARHPMKTVPDPELLAALRPWLERADGLIDRRLADARQHAAAGSLPTATARIWELAGQLNRHIGDARAHFYRSAFVQHARAGLDPDVHDLAGGPDPGRGDGRP